MRLALVSDIQGNRSALQPVIDDVGRHQVDTVVNLSDTQVRASLQSHVSSTDARLH